MTPTAPPSETYSPIYISVGGDWCSQTFLTDMRSFLNRETIESPVRLEVESKNIDKFPDFIEQIYADDQPTGNC